MRGLLPGLNNRGRSSSTRRSSTGRSKQSQNCCILIPAVISLHSPFSVAMHHHHAQKRNVIDAKNISIKQNYPSQRPTVTTSNKKSHVRPKRHGKLIISHCIPQCSTMRRGGVMSIGKWSTLNHSSIRSTFSSSHNTSTSSQLNDYNVLNSRGTIVFISRGGTSEVNGHIHHLHIQPDPN